jgi:hypothetical protein
VELLDFDAKIVDIEKNKKFSLGREGLSRLLADMAHNRRMRLATFKLGGGKAKMCRAVPIATKKLKSFGINIQYLHTCRAYVRHLLRFAFSP